MNEKEQAEAARIAREVAGEEVINPLRAKKDRSPVLKPFGKQGRLTTRKTAMRFRRIQLMLKKGMTAKQIQAEFGFKSVISVYKIMKKDYFKNKEEDITKDAIQQAKGIFNKNVTKATNKVVSLMENGENKQKIQLEAAREILHQAGLKPVEVVETRGREYTPEELLSARETVMEISEMTAKLGEKDSQFVIGAASPGSPVAADAASSLPTEEQVKQALEKK